MNTDTHPAPWDLIRGLFHPGNGVMPPVLAGREEEQVTLDEFLFSLQNSRPADKDIIVYGPRGNGKTVFLNRFEDTAMAALGEDQVLSLRPDDINSRDNLALHLIDRDKTLWDALKERLPSKMALSGKLMDKLLDTSGRLELEWNKLSQQEQAHNAEPLLVDSLIKRCRKKPLVVTIDEAHTLDIDVGKYLLNLSERVRKKGAPFLLILAGTPGLEKRINSMHATFWSRARILGFSRLTKQATTDAIVGPLTSATLKPLLEQGYDFTFDALKFVIDDSQQYPYFIQLWGECLCKAMLKQETMRIDMTLVEIALMDCENQRRAYYRARYSEIVEESLLDAAIDVARAFTEQTELSEQDLTAVINLDTKQRLMSLGYIWQKPTSTRYEPGIPSLMDFVLTEDSTLDGKRLHTVTPEPVSKPSGTLWKL